MTTREKFAKLMGGMSTDGIIDAMRQTWNEDYGEVFREIGFEIIDSRVSEAESDRIYTDLYHEMN